MSLLHYKTKGTRRPGARGTGTQQAFSLIECLIYIAVLAIIMGLAFAAYYRVNDNTRALTRNANDVIRAMQVGEQWRADIRAAVAPPRLQTNGTEFTLRIQRGAGEVRYEFRTNTLWRMAGTSLTNPPVLSNVKSARMEADPRNAVQAWRWELELQSRQKNPRVRPLFTFFAVEGAKRQ